MIPYLQVENLTKSFGDLVLFHEISFGIAQGQRIGLIAKNGSGKTTLLNIPYAELLFSGEKGCLLKKIRKKLVFLIYKTVLCRVVL